MTSAIKVPLALKLKISLGSLGYLFTKLPNVLIALFVALLMLGILLWSFNLDLLRYALFEGSFSFSAKVMFLLNGYASIFTNIDLWPALAMVVLSILFGINTTVFIYLVRRTAKLADSGKGVVASVLGLIGAGCAVCGTGILGPVLAGVGAGASVSLAMWVGIAAQLAGIILLAYSIFGLSIRAASLRE